MKRLLALFALVLGLIAVTSPNEARACANSPVSAAERSESAGTIAGIAARFRALLPQQWRSAPADDGSKMRTDERRTIVVPTIMLGDCARE